MRTRTSQLRPQSASRASPAPLRPSQAGLKTFLIAKTGTPDPTYKPSFYGGPLLATGQCCVITIAQYTKDFIVENMGVARTLSPPGLLPLRHAQASTCSVPRLDAPTSAPHSGPLRLPSHDTP